MEGEGGLRGPLSLVGPRVTAFFSNQPRPLRAVELGRAALSCAVLPLLLGLWRVVPVLRSRRGPLVHAGRGTRVRLYLRPELRVASAAVELEAQ